MRVRVCTGREARETWLNCNSASAHGAENVNTDGSKEAGKGRVSANCEKRQLVGDVLWLQLESSWGGLGGQWLPEERGQPQAMRNLPRACTGKTFPTGQKGRKRGSSWVSRVPGEGGGPMPTHLEGRAGEGRSVGQRRGSGRASSKS